MKALKGDLIAEIEREDYQMYRAILRGIMLEGTGYKFEWKGVVYIACLGRDHKFRP